MNASSDKEMLAALKADGEKLRQLTGEDQGPFFIGEPIDDIDLPGPENDACPNDMGFDRESGPLGCVLELHGKACECAARAFERQLSAADRRPDEERG